ncbi:hypothetical protein [Nisaea sp.]|uniref:hypothetical protein n=1 Tax=Nisaea sp. TaxID=2024842 RepID=UPI0032EFC496
MLRRDFIAFCGTSLLGVAGVSLMKLPLAHAAAPTSVEPGRSQRIAAPLAAALRAIGTSVCRTAADELEAKQPAAIVNFHVRNAGIGPDGAALIANALMAIDPADRPGLASFSLSYNEALGDEGARLLAAALPPTLRDLGLVGCGFSDDGGSAMLQWAAAANGLQMNCIEENLFSKDMRDQFRTLANGPRSLAVYV